MTGYPWTPLEVLASADLNAAFASAYVIGVPQIATISALRAATSTTVLQTQCFVQGYSATNDGGQGYFTVGANASDNGGTIINDASGRSWYRVVTESRYDIRFFGAKVDGATDDTAAWLAALAAVGWIEVPRGVTLFQPGQLEVSLEGQRISGAGGGPAIPSTRGGNGSVMRAMGSGGAAIKINTQFCMIENLCIDRTGTAVSGDDGIQQTRFLGSEGYIFTNLYTENHYIGVHLLTGGQTLTNCLSQLNVSHGFSVSNNGANLASAPNFISCQSINNGGSGFFNQALAVTGLTTFYGVFGNFLNCTSYNNSAGGFVFLGSTTSGAVATVNDVWLVGCFSSFDATGNTTQHGFNFYLTSGFNNRLSDCVAENSGGNGFVLDSTNVEWFLTGCKGTMCGLNGFYVAATENGNMSNCGATDNGVAGTTNQQCGILHYAGLLSVIGGIFTNASGVTTQKNGILSWNGADFIGAGFNCQGNATTNLMFSTNAGSAQLAAYRS